MKRISYFFSVVLLAFTFVQPSYAHRYFDSWCARWTTPDPMQRKYPSWSPYNYAKDNPIRFIDPNGDTVNAYVMRTLQSKVVTQGLVYVTATETKTTFSGYSIEPKSHDKDPKIAAGTYGAYQQYHSDQNGDYDPARLHMTGAVSESGEAMPNAEMHPGNTRQSTTGCIIVGEEPANHGNEIKGGTSIPAMRKINDIIDADGGPINIHIINPIQPVEPILPPVNFQPPSEF